MSKTNYIKLFLLFFAMVVAGHSYAQLAPYQNAKLSIDERVSDLLQRMTLEEKVAQMCQYVGLDHIKAAEKNMSAKQVKSSDANAFYPGLSTKDIERMVEEGKIGSFLHVVSSKEANYLQTLAQKSRLKIPLIIGIDAIHGNGQVAGSTIYPSPISISSSWDTALVSKASAYTAAEMLATGTQWTFTPNLDIARDPRWGRTGETFGEDPFLVSCMGVATIKAFQSNGVLACAKHLIAGSQPVNGLNKAPTDISERTLQELFLPPFKAAVDAGVYTVMPAHNELNGVPCHAHKYLMENVLREQMGFKGFYVSDWMDIERMIEIHRIGKTKKDAVYATVAAGMDMHMQGPGFLEPLLELVKEGKISEERINKSVARILEAKFKTGLFEKYLVAEDRDQLFTTQHKAAALDAAHKSIVLLKNNGILPLQKGKYKKILVTGPNSNNQAMLGDWSLQQPDENIVTVLEGVKNSAGTEREVSFFDVGKSIPDMKTDVLQQAADKAKNVDLVVLVVGDNALRFEGSKRTSGENIDRDDIVLPGIQQQLVEALVKAGKPVIVVLINGRPLAIPWIEENVPAILEAWEPGSFGGEAIADILFGKINPSAKLTVTVPRNVGQIGSYYNSKPSQFIIKYIGSKTGALYPFGYGLSYTKFNYSNFQLSNTNIKAGDNIEAKVQIANTGAVAGQEIVQLYINGSISSVTKPVKELKGFQRVFLQAGETKELVFKLSPELFKNYDLNMNYTIEPGEFTIMVGSSSAEKDLKKVKLNITL